MTEEELYMKHPCIINHIQRAMFDSSVKDEDICSFGGKMYETYGEEMFFVIEMARQNRVMTIIEGDEEEENEDGELTSVWYISNGMHHINRIGYLITEEPIGTDFFEVKLDY